jgi:hypothetical protein
MNAERARQGASPRDTVSPEHVQETVASVV